MKDSKLRIPRLAVAALVLGGACDNDGDGGKSGAAGTNTSDARIDKLASRYCDLYAECYPEDFQDSYDDKPDCVRTIRRDFQSYEDDYGVTCADAVLDLAECDLSASTCESDPDRFDAKCDALLAKAESACPELDIKGDDEELTQSSRPKRRSLRIPR